MTNLKARRAGMEEGIIMTLGELFIGFLVLAAFMAALIWIVP